MDSSVFGFTLVLTVDTAMLSVIFSHICHNMYPTDTAKIVMKLLLTLHFYSICSSLMFIMGMR